MSFHLEHNLYTYIHWPSKSVNKFIIFKPNKEEHNKL